MFIMWTTVNNNVCMKSEKKADVNLSLLTYHKRKKNNYYMKVIGTLISLTVMIFSHCICMKTSPIYFEKYSVHMSISPQLSCLKLKAAKISNGKFLRVSFHFLVICFSTRNVDKYKKTRNWYFYVSTWSWFYRTCLRCSRIQEQKQWDIMKGEVYRNINS
jgi:hypothetical protein